jgi:hypothetical protein
VEGGEFAAHPFSLHPSLYEMERIPRLAWQWCSLAIAMVEA